MRWLIVTAILGIMLLSVSHLVYTSKARVVKVKENYELKQQEIKRERILKDSIGFKP